MESEINPNNFDNKDVDVVVNKYKRAAAFLWTILHAQGCQLSGDRCTIQGCSDVKRLLVHILSCTACPGHVCPIAYEGCHQARKLILHYRECRKKKHAQRSKGQKSHCLLCTLLARHKPIKIVQGTVHEMNIDLPGSSASSQESKDLIIDRRIGTEISVSPLNITRSLSSQIMPPPPPRPKSTSQGSINCPHGSPMSMCGLTLSERDENKYCESTNPSVRRAVRIRSCSLDDKKVHVNTNRFQIDSTAELDLEHPSEQNEELRPHKSLASNCSMHQRRRRSMSCSNMPSSGPCDTILEETTSDHG